ncbi:SAM-dependent methyltransferase [Haladaptatus paucihalophilus]|uniref:Tetrapyrrole (Corrin/Porphyrin) Methylases n=1 Tax=Haladaptatus paucihalophilus DX253 TaxID=797209 RepID=A0A1M6NU33_HALPU|nr:SAM-dependent methyltransferase [Haladaptatus paucihalophilus]SHJ99257.1 Tetrapyrrole (Corrin/Porphyrin) Methylases [Haladaptatus paucihalophilus DX253]
MTNNSNSDSTNFVDIYVIGTGMVGTRQFTQEAISALEQCERVYLVHFQKSVKKYLEEFTDQVHVLTDEYNEGEKRDNTYARMAQQVLDGAEESEGPVVFALYGHPMVFVSPSRWVIDEAPERGLEVEVQPGISSMDCLYSDIAFDPAKNGVQMFEASDLLLREFDLNPDIPAMIWQVGMLESALYTTNSSEPERFTRFREYLERFYPPDHSVSLLQTATYPISNSRQIEFEIKDFEKMADEINAIQTLYIPPANERPVQNEELAELFKSKEHIETITNKNS